MCFGELVSNSLPVTERTIETNGLRLHTLEAGEPGAPVVVLAHGFPELAYSWRHQIPALAAAGYHVLAPDQRGYGRSTRPADIADYNIAELSADLIGLLDDVGAEKAVFIGHDWGAQVAWGSAQLHPDRVAAVVGLSVPPVPRAQVPPTQGVSRDLRRQLFLHALFPTARGRRCRTGRRPGQDPSPGDFRSGGTGDQRPHCGCFGLDRRVSSSASRSPTGCRAGSALTNSTTTSPNSAAPVLPVG